MNTNLRIVAAVILASSLQLGTARAGRELFSASAEATDGSGLRRSMSSSKFFDLVSDVVRAENSFSAFRNRPGFAKLNYAGVSDAITFQQNADGTESILRIPITGLEKRFTGSNRGDVEDKIVDYLKSDGEDEYEKFIEAINRRSKVSPIDGNPSAATAQIANATFGEFGFPTGENDKGNLSGGSLVAAVGRFSAGQFDGDAYSLPLSFTLRATESVSIVLNVPLSYIVVNDSEVYNVGLGLSVPVRFIQATPAVAASAGDGKTTAGDGKATAEGKSSMVPAQRWTWQVTPTVGGIASGSEDFGTGGVIGQLALTNMVSYRFDHFTLAMGNHVSWLEGIPVEVSDYNVSAGVSQVLIKNGLQVSVPLGDRWLVTAYGIYSRFLEDAAIEDYVTVGAELGLKIRPDASNYLKLGLYSDIGNDYTSGNVRLGTGWKF